MPSVPASADPGWDEDLAWLDRDPMTAAEREAWLDRLCQLDDDPCDAAEEYRDPESCAPPPGEDELTAEELAGVARPLLMRCSRWMRPVPGGGGRGRRGRRGCSRESRTAGRPGSGPGWRGT